MQFLSTQLFFWLIAAGVACITTACDLFMPTKTTAVNGIVTVCRNGEPWKPDHITKYDSQNYIRNHINEAQAGARMQPPPPPYDRPRIYAYTSANKNKWLGDTDANYPENTDDALQGKFTWTIEIPSQNIPGLVYFEIETPMAGLLPNKMTGGIWVEEGSVIDLGIIDYDVIRLYGNLPVTFNGKLPTWSGNTRLNRTPAIYFMKTDGSYLSAASIDSPNGNWLKDIYVQDSEIPLVFTLNARENGGVFKQVLNPNHEITIHDTDKEIIFPDYPSIDFSALTLSGTIDFRTSLDMPPFMIFFYDGDYADEHLIGVVDIVHWQIEKDENGFSKWETMVPFFPLPQNLLFEVVYKQYSNILITDYTDIENLHIENLHIENLHLGTFIYP